MRSPFDESGNYIGPDSSDKGLPFAQPNPANFGGREMASPMEEPRATGLIAPTQTQRQAQENWWSQQGSQTSALPITDIGLQRINQERQNQGLAPLTREGAGSTIGGMLSGQTQPVTSPAITQLMNMGYSGQLPMRPTLQPQSFRPYSRQIRTPFFSPFGFRPQQPATSIYGTPARQQQLALNSARQQLALQQRQPVLQQPASQPVQPQPMAYNPFMGLTRSGGFIPAQTYNPYGGASMGSSLVTQQMA